jgi:hypothetical protein
MLEIAFLLQTAEDGADRGLLDISALGYRLMNDFDGTWSGIPYRLHYFVFEFGERRFYRDRWLSTFCHGTTCTAN